MNQIYKRKSCANFFLRKNLLKHFEKKISEISHIFFSDVGATGDAFKRRKGTNTTCKNQSQGTICSSYFVEPVKWMEILILGVLDGMLACNFLLT